MFDVETLQALQNVDIQEVNREDLADIQDLLQNPKETREERVLWFLEHCKGNPYIYRDGDYIVKNVFQQESGLTFADCTKQLIAKKARISL